MVLMKPVVFEFIGDIDQDEHETGNADGKTQDIQNGIVEMLQDIPDGNGK